MLSERDELQVVPRFAGEPRTEVVTDHSGAVQCVVVHARALTPRRAKWADFLGGFTAFGLMGLALLFVNAASAQQEQPTGMWLTAFIGPWLLTGLFRMAYRRLLRKATPLGFSEDHFVVQHALGEPVIYNRHQVDRFRLREHRDAKGETERNQLYEEKARMRGQVIRRKRYYSDSFMLRVIYDGTPREVIEILGEWDAELVLTRVQAVNKFMDQVMATGQAVDTGPASEWDDMAGPIPEEV